MIFETIDGFCGFHKYYQKIAQELSKKSVLVEVGVWKGKSLSALVEYGLRYQKYFNIYAIDTWLGSENEQALLNTVDSSGGADEFYLQFLKTMKKNNLLSNITSIRMQSHIASKLFDDESLDFVFIDANHTYEKVKQDIECWLPKIKQGGIISGHDYYIGNKPSEPIIRAVNEKFDSIKQYYDGVWEYHK